MALHSKAFTLIELLVVVTIIVVLLALLTPALDKAIQQAERVQCGAKLHAQDLALKQYAMDKARRYPPPLHDSHWPDGGMSTQGGLPGAFTPEFKPPAGQMVLYAERYLSTDPDFYYCSSNSGSWTSRDKTWSADREGDNNRYYTTYIHFPFFAGLKHTSDTDGRLAAITATQGFRAPGSRVTITENITMDFALGQGIESKNHPGDGTPGIDAKGDRYDNAPAGGNVLTNDGAVEWRAFSRCLNRLRMAAGERWWWF